MGVEVPLGGVTDCLTKDTLLTGAKGRALCLDHGVSHVLAGNTIWGKARNERQRVKGRGGIKKKISLEDSFLVWRFCLQLC